VVIFSVFM